MWALPFACPAGAPAEPCEGLAFAAAAPGVMTLARTPRVIPAATSQALPTRPDCRTLKGESGTTDCVFGIRRCEVEDPLWNLFTRWVD